MKDTFEFFLSWNGRFLFFDTKSVYCNHDFFMFLGMLSVIRFLRAALYVNVNLFWLKSNNREEYLT